MKALFLIIIAMAMLVSCDKRTDVLVNENNAPITSIQINNQFAYLTANVSGNGVVDSCKTNRFYRFELAITDESEYLQMEFIGDGNLFLNSALFQNGTYINGTYQFEWQDTTVGLKTFQIKITDPLGGVTEYDFSITVFENIIPSISWQLTDVGLLDPLEKKITVSGNDGDVYYGGDIIYYQFIINGDTTNYPAPEFLYIFPQPGLYNIGVRAMDNNYEWGNEITINNYSIN